MAKKRKNKASGKWLLVGFLALVLAGLMFVFFSDGARRKVRQFAEQNIPNPKSAPAGQTVERKTRSVALFFLSADDDLLHRESRKVATAASMGDEAENIIRELIKGSTGGLISPLPSQTKIRQVYVTDEGVAYVDFSRDLIDKFAYGSEAELETVYAVVDTLAYNFKSIKKVIILVEGSEKDTLGGHVDLSKPITPDFQIVAK